jgi:hypothetical protein
VPLFLARPLAVCSKQANTYRFNRTVHRTDVDSNNRLFQAVQQLIGQVGQGCHIHRPRNSGGSCLYREAINGRYPDKIGCAVKSRQPVNENIGNRLRLRSIGPVIRKRFFPGGQTVQTALGRADSNKLFRRQSDAGSFKFIHTVQALKNVEKFVRIRYVEPDAIISYKDHGFIFLRLTCIR